MSVLAAVVPSSSVADELVSLGWEVSAHQRRLVQLAAVFDESLEWFRSGATSAAAWIAGRLQIQSSTAREWIRVGHALRDLPLVDAAWAAREVSYAKVRVLTRWADESNEADLVELGRERSADRLTVAIARFLADSGESDEERDARLHHARSFTSWTDGDGMTVIRVVVPPSVAKPVVAAVDELVRRIAATPMDASVDAGGGRSVTEPVTERESGASVDAPETPLLADRLHQLRSRWQPSGPDNDWVIPSLAQQRADAFVVLFSGLEVDLTTEVVIHVRGDGATFDDGTPTTGHAVLRQLDHSFIRLLLHDTERRPINASSRRRHPTTRQKRVVLEQHRGECVDCQSPDLLEYDHNPPYEHTGHTITTELEPRCAPCHRTRHRADGAARSRAVTGRGSRVLSRP